MCHLLHQCFKVFFFFCRAVSSWVAPSMSWCLRLFILLVSSPSPLQEVPISPLLQTVSFPLDGSTTPCCILFQNLDDNCIDLKSRSGNAVHGKFWFSKEMTAFPPQRNEKQMHEDLYYPILNPLHLVELEKCLPASHPK